jgi:hypothetical protein
MPQLDGRGAAVDDEVGEARTVEPAGWRPGDLDEMLKCSTGVFPGANVGLTALELRGRTCRVISTI